MVREEISDEHMVDIVWRHDTREDLVVMPSAIHITRSSWVAYLLID